MDQPLGITVKSCQGLLGVDKSGTSDPYVKLRPVAAGSKKEEWCKTEVIKKELNPVWNASFDFSVHGKTEFEVEVWDHNKIMSDKCIGHCKINFADEDLVKEEFPSLDIPVKISRSLGEGKGTITLVLLPSFGSPEKKRQLAIAKAKKESASWPTHTFDVPGGCGRISVRLPKSLKALPVEGNKYAEFENDAATLGEVVSFMATKSTETINNREDLEKAMEKRISEVGAQSGNKTVFTGERGELTISGVDVMWASFFADYSHKDQYNPFGNIITSYIFGLGGIEQQVIFMSVYQRHRSLITMDGTLERHRQRYDELWTHVLDSLTIESA